MLLACWMPFLKLFFSFRRCLIICQSLFMMYLTHYLMTISNFLLSSFLSRQRSCQKKAHHFHIGQESNPDDTGLSEASQCVTSNRWSPLPSASFSSCNLLFTVSSLECLNNYSAFFLTCSIPPAMLLIPRHWPCQIAGRLPVCKSVCFSISILLLELSNHYSRLLIWLETGF